MADKDAIRWSPGVELSKVEEAICKRCHRTGRLFSFLRRHRHELFDEAFQEELTVMYADSPLGQPPRPPALLGLVTILQAAHGVSDAAAVEEAMFDRRWQMVLGCIGTETPPFSQGSLVDFRRRLMENGLHHRLVERSVELAKATGGFGYKNLRVALDSAPLWGAGRVEDTFNLIGHALDVVVSCAAHAAQLSPEAVREGAALEVLGGTSIKASLDIDWDDKREQHRALQRLLADVRRLREWLGVHLRAHVGEPPLRDALDQLERVIGQDLEPDPDNGGSRIARGTARDRQISISDPEMRHGRKSRSQVIKGYKRFIARELDHGLIVGVTVQPANQPERDATETLREQASAFGDVVELHIDRGFLASEWAKDVHERGDVVSCRPWPTRNRGLFGKQDFELDLEAGTARCPGGVTTQIGEKSARFPAKSCDACPLRARCTRAKEGRGRVVSIHPQEDLLAELRGQKATKEGRKRLRERVAVEHGLAHICNRQGRRARYVGVDKNVLDLCRYAVVENLFAADRAERRAA
ncbi:MAG: IS1182 family transposase [Gemmatimonadetes bacterium]|nr:MAG: IS1182 family transposase [Gemmatimonadota bacterium]